MASRISLSGSEWHIRKDEINPEDFLAGAPLTGGRHGWVRALVPGNIQSDLETAHIFKPLWYGVGDPALADAARHDWWYCRDFDINGTDPDQRVHLVFGGVDEDCEVWLNGVRIGGHAGMYQQFWFEVSDTIQREEKNRIIVKLNRMPEVLVPSLIASDGAYSGGKTPYNFIQGVNRTRQVLKRLKSPTNFSYDWGTNIWTLGIWKDVCLEITGAARIAWIQVSSRLNGSHREASVPVSIEVDSDRDLDCRTVFILSGNGADESIAQLVSLKKGNNRIEAVLTVHNPTLWWPCGQGEQPLYTVEARLEDMAAQVIDSKTVRTGIREIRWEQVEGAPEDFINPFRLIVNGRPVRTMGSNLVPPDLLFGRIMERGPRLLQLAKAAGINTLRLWGGGVILPEGMYDLADELGILLFQEFPMANCLPERDKEFLVNLEDTVRNIVRQIRNHPSIIEWSGGNEMAWVQGTDHPALHVMERV
ncbi:MAG TPA: hypothetical protein DD727_01725, partial [Clostridiales bacterium]|nr:hypothetical protein [Clostridiales bacterium]